nr:MAG: ORF1 [TTV-like mini virus]
MPTYWKRRRTNYFKRRRRPWFSTWRARRTFRRRFYKKRYRKRRYKVKKKKFYKRKTKIVIKQFVPKSMKRCKIIGTKCLVQGSPLRCHHNFIQYYNSKVPEFHPGGGGWSQIIFSLDSLYDDFLKLQNIWTKSNCTLPLARYRGCTMKFYQTDYVDYIVIYDTCWPMVDTYLSHADASPASMFLKKNKICIPSRQTQTRKKPFKKVFIHPPSQMYNKWYFQKEICTTPLLMLTTTTTSFTKPYCDSKATSNNISIKCLNPYIFQNLNFQTYPQTSGYYCKKTSLEDSEHSYPMYLYAVTKQHNQGQAITVSKNNIKSLGLIPLCNPKTYSAGKPMSDQTWENNAKNWGNPFYHDILDMDSYTVYISLMTPIEAYQLFKDTSSNKTYNLTLPTGPLIYTLRYNPETDKGLKNKAWILSTSKTAPTTPPDDINLILEGFPLFILFWGWTDWIKKTKIIPNLNRNGIVVFTTDQFDIQLPLYIPLDLDYIEGYDPYQQHDEDGLHRLPSSENQSNWFPQLTYQDQTIEKICMSGPGCPRLSNKQYIQAMVKYKFHFTWGGCPKTLEKACNPCSQPTWTTPDNMHGRLEIQNPNTNPLTELYKWDWDGDYVTAEAIQRIQAHTTTDKSSFISTANKNTSQAAIQKKQEKTQEEEEKTLLNQLQLLQQQRQQLQSLLLNRLTTR